MTGREDADFFGLDVRKRVVLRQTCKSTHVDSERKTMVDSLSAIILHYTDDCPIAMETSKQPEPKLLSPSQETLRGLFYQKQRFPRRLSDL